MSGAVQSGSGLRRSRFGLRPIVLGGVVAVLVVAMALDTKVVRIGSSADIRAGVFTPDAYGKAEFPKVQAAVVAHATDAPTLAAAIGKDPDAATKQYGVASDAGPEFPVKFSGAVSKDEDGDYVVAVPGMPSGTRITLQTGPAITGTDLRDGTGLVSFGQFSNQIDYQNAGSALNNEMKRDVLSKIDVANLAGKTVAVVGVFQLTDPAAWQVTPVKLDIRP